MSDGKKVLIPGAAGLVGGILRRHWGDRHQLRLTDVRPVDDLASHEEFVEIDITQYDQMLTACSGMDVVVHLAADPSMQAEFYDTLLPLNIIGAYNAFEAAAKQVASGSSLPAASMPYWVTGTRPTSSGVSLSFRRTYTARPNAGVRPWRASTRISTICRASVCAWAVRASTRAEIGTQTGGTAASAHAIAPSSLVAVWMSKT